MRIQGNSQVDNPEPSLRLEEGATTIPEGSTPQAIGGGSALPRKGEDIV